MKTKRNPQNHLFVETDVFEDDRQFNINEISKNVNTNNNRYLCKNSKVINNIIIYLNKISSKYKKV